MILCNTNIKGYDSYKNQNFQYVLCIWKTEAIQIKIN